MVRERLARGLGMRSYHPQKTIAMPANTAGETPAYQFHAAKVRISEQNTKGKPKFFFLFSNESTFEVNLKGTKKSEKEKSEK